MRIRPLNDYILVEADEIEKEVAGIVLQEVEPQSTIIGTIVRVNEDSLFKSGERIAFRNFIGEEMVMNGEKVRMIPETEVLATIDY